MAKKHRHRHRRKTMKGGFFEGWFDSSSTSSTYQPEGNSWYSGMSDTLSGWKDKISRSISSNDNTTNYTPSTNDTTNDTTNDNNNQYQQAGKTKKRKIKGGFVASKSVSGLAANSASFSGQTAKPHTWVGGKTRKRSCRKKHKHIKSCKNRK
jgi:hypothetical protein